MGMAQSGKAAVVRGLAAQQAAFVVVSSERQARRFARRSGRENFTTIKRGLNRRKVCQF